MPFCPCDAANFRNTTNPVTVPPPDPMPDALIFDIDGTLVDSVDLHAKAWQEAFAHFGHEVAFVQVRSQLGKGGDQLMPVFLSPEDFARRGEEIEAYRSNLFKTRYLPQVRGFP